MTDAAQLETLLRRVVREELQRLQPSSLKPAQCLVLDRLYCVFGTASFSSSEVLSATRLDLVDRRALRDALQTITEEPLDSHVIGLVLRSIIKNGGSAGALRLTTATHDRGSRVWCVAEGG